MAHARYGVVSLTSWQMKERIEQLLTQKDSSLDAVKATLQGECVCVWCVWPAAAAAVLQRSSSARVALAPAEYCDRMAAPEPPKAAADGSAAPEEPQAVVEGRRLKAILLSLVKMM